MQRLACLAFVLSISLVVSAQSNAQPAKAATKSTRGNASGGSGVLVIVNGQKVTESDLQRSFQIYQVPDDKREEVRGRFLQNLVDARLIGQFLTQKKVAADKKEIDAEVTRLKDLEKSSKKPGKTLAELGYTDEVLREEFVVPLAWRKHFSKTTTPAKLRQFFEAHHLEFDGTRVRAKHVLLKVASEDESDWLRAEAELARLRKKIAAGELTFDQAALEFSDAPSKDKGGDVGWFDWLGMPTAFSEQAFALKPGELSQPFRTKSGVHLCLVTDKKIGMNQLEDIRDDVLAKMLEDVYRQTAADLRQTAKIEWKVAEPAR